MRCVYCLEDKSAEAFAGREHVMPQAFGRFSPTNLVLRCVCDACNGAFGRGIDEKLARDSAEAIDRVLQGVKPASEYKGLGARSTSHVEFVDGNLAGGRGYAIANPDGGTVPGVTPFAQVWFAKSPDGPWDVFLLEDVPTLKALVERGYDPRHKLYIRTFEIEDPFLTLESKGYNFTESEQEAIEPLCGRVPIEHVTTVAEPEFRAVTKIALNYLAYTTGPSVALEPAFDQARTFARYGPTNGRVRVYPRVNPWFVGRRGHYVSLTRAEDMIVAQLSIHMRIQYLVVLAEGDPSVTLHSAAHLFDLDTREVKEIEPLPLTPGFALRPVKR